MKKLVARIANRLCVESKVWIPALMIVGWPITGSGMEVMEHHAHHPAPQQSTAREKGEIVQVHLLSEELQTQDGETVNLSEDLGEERILVMNFIYTTCTTVCPVSSAVFQQLQGQLQDRQERDVTLVSVTVDPVRDTIQRIKSYASRFEAGKDWLWLTGEKRRVDRVLEGLGAYTPEFRDHPAMVLVGDPSTNSWVRFFGFPSPERLLRSIDELKMTKHESLAGHSHAGHLH